MHYIRFVKWPYVTNKGTSIAGSFMITTDLGDTFLAGSCGIKLVVSACSSGKVLSEKLYEWCSGLRSLNFDCKFSDGIIGPLDSLELEIQRTDKDGQTTPRGTLSPVIGLRVQVAISSQEVIERQIQRLFSIGKDKSLIIFEDAADSIARHIWDAGLIFTYQLAELANDGECQLHCLKHKVNGTKNETLRVVELGTGCGLVGIAAASVITNCVVVLTDLEDAQAIAQKNIEANKPEETSTTEFHVQEWGQPLVERLLEQIDIVLITDCVYNFDTVEALVSTINELTCKSPSVLVIVAMKMRHPNEAVFFDLMVAAGLEIFEQLNLPLPSVGSESFEEVADEIQIYCYRLVKESSMREAGGSVGGG